MKKLVLTINNISEIAGQIVKYLLMALIVVLCYEVVARYFFSRPTNWVLETSKMLMGTFGACGWAYTFLHEGHVRVDVFYSNFSRRTQAWVNVIMSIIFLFPICIILIAAGIRWAAFAWKIGEKMVESSWLPPAAPFRTILVVGFILFTLQSIAKFIQELYYLIRKRELL
ncbi:MAG TPA: TRAP transporter small permease subunit [Atribacterota bacterium]|nr:TRAP transporter small permease subunit [Atribacterota bacterium]